VKEVRLKARLRNYGFWLAVGSLLGIVLKDVGILKTLDSTWDVFVTAVLGLFVAFGIINSPVVSSKGESGDKKCKENRDE